MIAPACSSQENADVGESESESEGESESESEGESLDPACTATDPDVDSALVIDLSAWYQGGPVMPKSDPELVFAGSCEVTALTTNEGKLTTQLECDDDGVLRTLSVTFTAPELSVAWAPGDDVTLRLYQPTESFSDYLSHDEIAMHRASDGALLLSWLHQEHLYAENFEPVAVTVDENRCGYDENDAESEDLVSMALTFENGVGDNLELFSGGRGTLATPEGEGVFAIDVGLAKIGYCCHHRRAIQFLLRRVVP